MKFVKCYTNGVYSDLVDTPYRKSQQEAFVIAVWHVRTRYVTNSSTDAFRRNYIYGYQRFYDGGIIPLVKNGDI